ncbi:MAG: tRNA (adenosine(37)-N6)-threonylcarbamoyltransferase complex ATPase subunit type 1 TsaE [Sphingomonadales bacterium]|nr:tRNA (adenosine(37)-N6)-threonylcarbamoyltransferase complex ATPase subunit type 1 TsaE [Sphingomonadales bacterium]
MFDLIFSIKEVDDVAGQLLGWVKREQGANSIHHQGPYAISLSGSMGSGKTTLIRAMGKHLGCSPLPSSPTFSLIQNYLTAGGNQVVHADLFRLLDAREWLALDPEMHYLDAEWLWVEWPDKAAAYMPKGMAQFELKAWNIAQNSTALMDQRRLIFTGWVP